MALSSGFCNIHGFPEMVYPRRAFMPQRSINWDQRTNSALKHLSIESFSQRVIQSKAKPGNVWSFIGGSKLSMRQMLPEQKLALNRRHHGGRASGNSRCMMSEIASTAFTIGTVAVLPFYTLMVVAPKSELTKKAMKSSIPYVALGIVYAYLLYLSWTPETMQFMFASKYWLPELPGIARMFSNEMTLASAWIHLLAVDLFAARQVFRDGLENKIETRHSVSLCLLFCPVGIFTHFITKALAERRRN